MNTVEEMYLTTGLFLAELLLVYVGYAWVSGIFEEDRLRAEAHAEIAK